jgi:hypothetical protein
MNQSRDTTHQYCGTSIPQHRSYKTTSNFINKIKSLGENILAILDKLLNEDELSYGISFLLLIKYIIIIINSNTLIDFKLNQYISTIINFKLKEVDIIDLNKSIELIATHFKFLKTKNVNQHKLYMNYLYNLVYKYQYIFFFQLDDIYIFDIITKSINESFIDDHTRSRGNNKIPYKYVLSWGKSSKFSTDSCSCHLCRPNKSKRDHGSKFKQYYLHKESNEFINY